MKGGAEEEVSFRKLTTNLLVPLPKVFPLFANNLGHASVKLNKKSYLNEIS